MRFIGIHGKARSGKDEFCSILCTTYGFQHISFADTIRNLGVKYYKLKKSEITDKKTKESRQILQGIGLSVRKHISTIKTLLENPEMISIGVSGFPRWSEELATKDFNVEEADLRRRLKYLKTVLSGNVEMWTNELETFVKGAKGTDTNIWLNLLLEQYTDDLVYVISDVRFMNEYDFLLNNSSAKLIKILRVDNPLIEAGANHPSENELNHIVRWDKIITNEAKTNWRDGLVLAGSNMVRQFKHLNFFTDKDIEKFKINIEW